MRSNNLLMLAGLASSALAYPTNSAADRRSLGLDIDIDLSLNLGGLFSGLLGGGAQSPTNILSGIGPQGAAALQGAALGVKAGSIRSAARKELASFLRGENGGHLESNLRKPLLNWATGGDDGLLTRDVSGGLSILSPAAASIASEGGLVVTLEGILGASDIGGQQVLTSELQDTLNSFLKGSGKSGLTSQVKSALHLAGGGGLVSSLSGEVKSALETFLGGSGKSGLTSELTGALQAWLQGGGSNGLVSLGEIPSGGLTAISVGKDILSRVDSNGLLGESSKAGIAGFLTGDVASSLESDVKEALQAMAHGKAAKSLSPKSRHALAKWISGSDCKLGVQFKSIALFWLSVGVDVDVSVNINGGGLLGGLLSFVLDTVNKLLSTVLGGVLSIVTGGESLLGLSLDARAELAAVLGGAADIDIDLNINLTLLSWLTGIDLNGAIIIGGSGSGSGSSSSASLPAGSNVPQSSKPASSSPTPTPD